MLKSSLSALAICGGRPAFGETLHVGRPNLGERTQFLRRVEQILDSRWFTNNGPVVQEFGRALETLLGVRHVIPACNATVALELVIRAAGLQGEVIVPSFTFVATAHALQWQQITPVFADVDPVTHCLDPVDVERRITDRTTGIIGVHVWGRPCDIDGLQSVATRHRLELLFDAAHALGCSYRGRKIGGFGRAEVFSFHATKFCNSFEGGAIATDDDDLAARIRLMMNFGFAGYDDVRDVGTNGKMTEVCAAMGLTSLDSLDAIIAVNEANYRHYVDGLRDCPAVHPIRYDVTRSPNYQYVVFETDLDAPLTRDDIIAVLWAENVHARRYFYPGCHRMEPYRSAPHYLGVRLPETEALCDRVFALPTGTSIAIADIDVITAIISTALKHPDAVRASLAARAGVLS